MSNIFPYSVVILKPDAHRDALSEMIVSDLEQAGFVIVLRKDIVLSQDQAENIYSVEKNNPYYENAVKSLLGTEKNRFSTLLVLKFKKNDNDVISATQDIKGEVGRGGIRGKYFIHSKDILEKMGFVGDDLENELRKNRLHVPDTRNEIIEIINMLVRENEKLELGEREPELYNELVKMHNNREISKEILSNKKPR